MSPEKKKYTPWLGRLLFCFIAAMASYFAAVYLFKDSIQKVIVCVDAPDMLDGPGSVVLVDSDKQPVVRRMFPALEQSCLVKYIGINKTVADPGMPFIYISVVWQSGKKTVLSSMNVLKKQKQSEIDDPLVEALRILAVDHDDITRGLQMAEKSEIHDDPIKLYSNP